jgi:hypothetical protein
VTFTLDIGKIRYWERKDGWLHFAERWGNGLFFALGPFYFTVDVKR